MTREEEARIVRNVLDGDVDEFERLVNEYQRNVYNLALRMVGNPEDASDMSQEAFIKAYSSLADFRGDSKFSVWLYRIVSNVCLDFLRKRNRRQVVSLTVEDEDDGDVELDIADEESSPELLLERKLTREAVRRGLDSLPHDMREILLLREIQGLSYDEIAQVLQIEAGTIKSRIFRARKKLCAFLEADGNFPDFAASNKNGRSDAP